MSNVVLITGASSGLGEEFAFQLAAQGYSLLLTARRESRLAKIKSSILARYPAVSIYFFSADLSQPESAQKMLNYVHLKSLSLIGLINNAGFGLRGAFADLSLAQQMDMLQVNINALVRLTYLFIPLLTVQKESFIINVSSTAAFQAGPNLAIYYASKAFVLSFSQALYEELKEQGIAVSALCPGATKTEFTKLAGMSESTLFKLRAMDKKPVVRAALANKGKAVVIPGLINKICVLFVQLVPSALARKLANLIQK